jgi:phosphoribosylanthranilate isomerase
LDLLQFHGEESPQACRSFGRAYIKAVPMGAATDPGQYMARYPDAIGFLVDSHRPGHMGGLGAVLDWTRVPKMRRPLILAGGLDMHNVAEALRVTRPYGVDVSSGVESARGIKDAHKIEAFISEVRRVDCHAG